MTFAEQIVKTFSYDISELVKQAQRNCVDIVESKDSDTMQYNFEDSSVLLINNDAVFTFRSAL